MSRFAKPLVKDVENIKGEIYKVKVYLEQPTDRLVQGRPVMEVQNVWEYVGTPSGWISLDGKFLAPESHKKEINDVVLLDIYKRRYSQWLKKEKE